jgi:hypothetical protein
MKLTPLEFSQKCLANIDYNYLILFDFNKGYDSTLSTYPQEWCAHYTSQDYQDFDYPLQKKTLLPFGWGEKLTKDLSPMQRKIFKEAQDFNIYTGLIVPYSLPDSSGVLALTFGKSEKLSYSKIQKLSLELHFYSQLVVTYTNQLKKGDILQDSVLQLFNELESWQKESEKQKKKKESEIREIMSDIRATQMFISHHETKDLGLETLERAYRDLQRLKE